MPRGLESQSGATTLPLQNAVLCVDCESVSTSRCDECPACGGRSLLGLAGVIGGTLLDYKSTGLQPEQRVLFDLQITIELKNLEGHRLSSAIERITSLVAPNVGRDQASCHIRVEPVVCRAEDERIAA